MLLADRWRDFWGKRSTVNIKEMLADMEALEERMWELTEKVEYWKQIALAHEAIQGETNE